jgi:pimeloyl-ACP methyl ester carboxylesterase
MSHFRSEAAADEFRARYRDILRRWPVANERLFVPTRQGETFVVACGDPHAPPLILLHGALANSAVWMGDVADWARDFRLYAVDVIGEPGLSAPSRPPLDSDAHAGWLDDILAGLSLEKASLVGTSLGGWIALDYATRRPERVQSLALMCPGGVGRQKMGVLFKVLPLMLLGFKREARALVLGPGAMGEIPQEFADFLDLIHRNFRARVTKLPVFGDEALRRLSMPVFAIVGGCDALFDSADTKRRLEAVGAKVVLLPQAGHLITGQGDAIHAFLREAIPSLL